MFNKYEKAFILNVKKESVATVTNYSPDKWKGKYNIPYLKMNEVQNILYSKTLFKSAKREDLLCVLAREREGKEIKDYYMLNIHGESISDPSLFTDTVYSSTYTNRALLSDNIERILIGNYDFTLFYGDADSDGMDNEIQREFKRQATLSLYADYCN